MIDKERLTTLLNKTHKCEREIENLNRKLRISDVIDVLMTQSLQLMEIVNKNQKEVNRLKEELEQLTTPTDEKELI